MKIVPRRKNWSEWFNELCDISGGNVQYILNPDKFKIMRNFYDKGLSPSYTSLIMKQIYEIKIME